MDLVYFIEDLNRKLDCTQSQKEANFNYLLHILPDSIKEKNITTDTHLCQTIIKSGARRFQICGYPCIENSDKCSSHSSTSIQEPQPEQPPAIIIPKGKPLTIRKNKYGHFLYPGTKLILSSAKDKTIKGVQNEIGECRPLQEEDINLCVLHNLKYTVSR